MMVPGVSGGSMAMILGVYDDLISAVSSFFKNPKGNLIFLGAFTAPALLGMVLFAEPLLNIIESYRLIAMYFFMGAVAGSIPMIYDKARVHRIDLKFFVCIIFTKYQFASIKYFHITHRTVTATAYIAHPVRLPHDFQKLCHVNPPPVYVSLQVPPQSGIPGQTCCLRVFYVNL